MTLPLELSIRVKALLEGGNESEYRIAAKSNETVGDFRERLATTSAVEPQKQRLIFQGRVLSSDSQKLSDAGLSDGCALHMVARPSNIPPPSLSRNSTANAEEDAAATSIPPGMSPLAGHIMQQTFLRRMLNRQQRPVPAIPVPVLGSGIPPDFQQELTGQNGRDDGGDPAVIRHVWRDHDVSSDSDIRIAVNGRNGCYVVNRQVEVNDRLTDEELGRGPVVFPAMSVFSNADRSGFQPLDGLPFQRQHQPAGNSNENTSRQSSGHQFIPGVASRAQVNELTYHLLSNVLSNLRRMPGHGDYSFDSNESQRPTFLTSTSAAEDARAAAGEALGMVGDAFVEIGRSLQTIGQQYDDGPQNSSGMYSPEGVSAVVDSMYHLVLTAPLVVPFLQPINSNTARRDNATAGSMPASISFISQPIVIPFDGSSGNNDRMPPPPPPPPPFAMSGIPAASSGDRNAPGGTVRPENIQQILEAHISLGSMFGAGENGGDTNRPNNNNSSNGNQHQQRQQQRGNAFTEFLDRLGALNNPGRRQRATSRGDAASTTSTTTEFSTASTTGRPLVAPNGLPNTEFFRNLSTSTSSSRTGTSGRVRQRSDSASNPHAAEETESSSSLSSSSGKRHKRE